MISGHKIHNAADATYPESKLALVLFAHHHGTDNIASQRFRGLLRYLPRSRYNVHVFTGPWLRTDAAHGPEITPVSAPLLSKALNAARLAVLWAMLSSGLPGHARIGGNSWISRVVELARIRVRRELAAGNRVVVMATYSPVDALIAARLLAQEEGVPLVQDFRDGLAYESLGRKGAFFRLLRRFLEGWAVRPAVRITSVTSSLVAHFAASYPKIPACLLFNGFDSDDISVVSTIEKNDVFSTSRDVVVGHFGRISASDGGNRCSFEQLLEFLERGNFSGSLAFFGTLTEFERDLLSKSNLNFHYYGQLSRQKAIEEMRNMSALLLVTSDRASVATGKIFEYLFSGRRIVLATLRHNEAARLLEEIGDDDLVIDFSNPATIPAPKEFADCLRRPFTRNRDRILRFEKSSQALELDAILQASASE